MYLSQFPRSSILNIAIIVLTLPRARAEWLSTFIQQTRARYTCIVPPAVERMPLPVWSRSCFFLNAWQFSLFSRKCYFCLKNYMYWTFLAKIYTIKIPESRRHDYILSDMHKIEQNNFYVITLAWKSNQKILIL